MKFTIACIQMDIAFGDIIKTIEMAKKNEAKHNEKPDIIVLTRTMDNRI